ncbi:MAG TPA: DNA replication/repair protein RecF [Gammaproteobacteria bacterium]|nr:DNA replication/repair protein RecF [Gammaproteobacteria bacterium]
MSLASLGLRHFRNIETADLHFSPVCNLIAGDNGAGKTNLLESIFYLSLSRSFRTRHLRHLLPANADYLQLVGKVRDENGHESVLGIRRSTEGMTIRINGETVHQSSRLAAFLPVQLIHPESHQLLEQGPKQRRQFLDWGVFHVEPSFLSHWQDYRHCLKQRNAALRQGQGEKAVRLWDERLIERGTSMTQQRLSYLQQLRPHIDYFCRQLLESEIEVVYRQGWPKAQDFASALREHLPTDQQQGFTRVGPHRADLAFFSDQHRVQDYFSRGQQKLLVCALRLAQIRQLRQATGQAGVLLIDDLAAELDQAHRNALLEAALKTEAQLFITTTHPDLLDRARLPACKLFHVKHGQVEEVVQ